MAPTKFGLFKARSREQSEQPSVENLLQSTDTVTPPSPLPARYITPETMAYTETVALSLDDLSIEKHSTPTRRASESGKQDCLQMGYKPLKNQPSSDLTSTSTLQDEDFDHIQQYEEIESTRPIDLVDLIDPLDDDGASTSCDANSLQFDETSIAPSEDMSVYCGGLKRPKKSRSKEEEQIMKDCDMWHASNVEVMQSLLNKRGTLDEQIKWQAIANARGLCTLTDNCTCGDCIHSKFLAGVTDGDGGLGAAQPLFNAVSVGCCIQ